MGSWLSYGLGTANENLPAFFVLISQKPGRPAALLPALGQRLPALGPPGRPVPRRGRPGALPRQSRPGSRPPAAARCSTASRELHQIEYDATLDPEINARIAQYEMAYRMQTTVPEVTDLSERARPHLRPVRPRRPQAGHVRGQLPAGPPAGRARRPVHPALSSRLGPPRRPARAASAS